MGAREANVPPGKRRKGRPSSPGIAGIARREGGEGKRKRGLPFTTADPFTARAGAIKLPFVKHRGE